MTDTTWMKQRMPCSVILGIEGDRELASVSVRCGDTTPDRSELSTLATDLTWKLCKEGSVTRQQMSEAAMKEVVRQLLT
jgi:hypothetical protein